MQLLFSEAVKSNKKCVLDRRWKAVKYMGVITPSFAQRCWKLFYFAKNVSCPYFIANNPAPESCTNSGHVYQIADHSTASRNLYN